MRNRSVTLSWAFISALFGLAGALNASQKSATAGLDSVVSDRRAFFTKSAAAAFIATGGLIHKPSSADAVGPVKVPLSVIKYSAEKCPPSRPIPGEKAMKGMRGLCVTVEAKLTEDSPKDLDKVGVYGFVTDAVTGDSVLANNPDLSTDAGQFSMVETVTTKDEKVVFDFVAAIPMEKDISNEENGIGELSFQSLRLISFPGGQQYGAINPCEMNEFSDECDAWEEENGPYQKGDFMVKSNPRTKGR
mmetsp:Transcript_939/g.1222  ORF Transcript_939/g.1222 Transcript_939/m.1222 type:complete len:247 (-) Transcript_939:314-1054(-)